MVKRVRRDSIAILGPGKVGTAVGFLLRSAGYEIAALAGRSEESCERAVPYTGGKVCTTFSDAANLAGCILITVRDDAILGVCDAISKGTSLRGKKVVHMSGAGGLDLLESARKSGARTASIHPIQSFADVKGAIENIPGTTFGVTADREIARWAVQFVEDLGGRPFFVSEDDKPLYHAAACVASNYLVTLLHVAEDIYHGLGLSREEAIQAFWPLVKGTVHNIEARGTVQSLTGPIARGDLGTLVKHMEAFGERQPSLLEFYCRLGVLTVDLARKKGTISVERSEEIKSLLKGGLK